MAARQNVYAELELQHLLEQNQETSPEDARSWLFYLQDGLEVVATCRVTPLLACEEFAALVRTRRSGLEPELGIRVSRLVVGRVARGRAAYKLLLADVRRWLLTHTCFRDWFAICRPKLAPIYVRIGGRVVATDLVTPARADVPYALIEGQVSQTLATFPGRDAAPTENAL